MKNPEARLKKFVKKRKNPQQSESEFCSKKITPWLKENNFWYMKVQNTGPYVSRKGVADYILCINGMFICMEIKREDNEQTGHQKNEKTLVREAGGVYLLVKPSDWAATKATLLHCKNNREEMRKWV